MTGPYNANKDDVIYEQPLNICLSAKSTIKVSFVFCNIVKMLCNIVKIKLQHSNILRNILQYCTFQVYFVHWGFKKFTFVFHSGYFDPIGG